MANEATIAICVPTVREEAIRDFLDAWSPYWQTCAASSVLVQLFVHEDCPRKTLDPGKRPHLRLTHTAHDDIERELGCREWIIPRASGACRSFPMYLAWKALRLHHHAGRRLLSATGRRRTLSSRPSR